MFKYHKLFFFCSCCTYVDFIHLFSNISSKALWSLCLLLYVLPTQNKSRLVLEYSDLPEGLPGAEKRRGTKHLSDLSLMLAFTTI